MTMRILSLAVFLMLCVLSVAQTVWYYPQLPDNVAHHFGLSGQPDAWSTKTYFVTLDLVATGVVALLFLGSSFGLSKIPVSVINLRNKDYWMAEERKQETLDSLFHYLLWFGSATLLLLLAQSHQAYQVHLGKTDSLSHPMLRIGLYVGFTIVWGIRLHARFGKRGTLMHKGPNDTVALHSDGGRRHRFFRNS